jgi:hypothetical protein
MPASSGLVWALQGDSEVVERAVLQHPHRLMTASQFLGDLTPFQPGYPQLDDAALIAGQELDRLQQRATIEGAQRLLFR